MSSRIYVKEPKLTRVVWNTNDWKSPSGPAGKSPNKDNHEHDLGYGYEEWLLDIDKQIDGFHYGFLQPFNRFFLAYTGKIFADIMLYTVKYPTPNSPQSGRYWVAHLKDVEALTQRECDWAQQEYDRLGWTEQMKAHIKKVTGQPDFSGNYNGRLLNIRFKVDGGSQIRPIQLIPKEHPVYKIRRFQLCNATGLELPY